MNNGGRLEWVDVLRVIAMFFVVLVHASTDNEGWWIYTVFTGPIMLPLFFAISGYLFKSGRMAVDFYKRLFKNLIIPWLFLSLIWLKMFLIPIRGIEWFWDSVYKLVSGKTAWFMPACIIAEIVFFYILKFCNKQISICIVVFVCVMIGFIMNHFNVGHFAMFNRALIAQAFLLCGYLFKCYQSNLIKIKGRYLVLGIMCYLLMGIGSIFLFPGDKFDVHLNMYPNIPLDFLMIFLGCFLVFILGNKVKKMPSILVFLGQNTLVCYFFHGRILNYMDKILGVFEIPILQNWMFSILESILAMLLCAVISLILNHFFPMFVGKKKSLCIEEKMLYGK